MSTTTILFLILRPVHVLLAATWLGAAVFMSYQLMPAVEEAGPAGGQIMIAMNRRGLTAFFAAVGGLTVVTGIYLYWRFTGGFGAEVMHSHAGVAFGIGGIAGLGALIVGGSVVGRSSGKVVAIMQKAGPMKDGPEKAALMQESAALRQRLSSAGHIVVGLQVIALVLMAIGHYI